MKWIQRPKNTVVSVGRSIFLPCQAEGSPQPKVYWRKLSQDRSDLEFHELRFNSITMQDGGTYECIATNGVDENLIVRIQLDVKGK